MKTFIIKTKEEVSLNCEYSVDAKTEEEARAKFKDGDFYTVDENFESTLSQEILKIEEDK